MLVYGSLDEEFGDTYSAHDGGGEATPAAEDGEDADAGLDTCEDEGDDKRPVHPLGSLLVHLQALVEAIAQYLLSGRVLELPDLGRVEEELELARGAVCDGLFAVGVLVALAVGPETDLVKVLERFGGRGAFQGGEQVVVEF